MKHAIDYKFGAIGVVIYALAALTLVFTPFTDPILSVAPFVVLGIIGSSCVSVAILEK